ncbi:hypothetical protein Naga_100763g5 [Nannochloropsis gaditana]|uniref:Uncharacterized protein n=1 Tax=Nannochloropsis gaditana TaxID=72520 RepID=W7T7G3_9STRA|nr:hypothetical protein Naga_100763g5 [Nannochloropsis gaditana]
MRQPEGHLVFIKCRCLPAFLADRVEAPGWMAASSGAAAAAAAITNAGKYSSSAGFKALIRGVVCSTLAVGTGDYICQQLEGSPSKDEPAPRPDSLGKQTAAQPLSPEPKAWDKERTLRMATATALVMSPMSWVIVMRLERVFPGEGEREGGRREGGREVGREGETTGK